MPEDAKYNEENLPSNIGSSEDDMSPLESQSKMPCAGASCEPTDDNKAAKTQESMKILGAGKDYKSILGD